MTRMKRIIALTAALPLAAVMLLSGCQQPQPEPEEIVAERAQARWDLMIERDFEKAWDYYSPGFRDTTPRQEFSEDMKRRPIRWYEADVLSVECDGDRCLAEVEVVYRAIAAPHGQSRIRLNRKLEENWIRLRGQWWYVAN